MQNQVPLIILPTAWYNSLDSFSLLAVPLFVFAGALMNVVGIAERIIGFTMSLLGHVKGGLAQANILTNSFMAAISGSTAADVAAVGSIMIPAMTGAATSRSSASRSPPARPCWPRCFRRASSW